MNKKKNKSHKGLNLSILTSNIKIELENNLGKIINYKQMSKALGITKGSDKMIVLDTMKNLVYSGEIEEVEPGRFRIKSKDNILEGIIRYHGATPFFHTENDNSDGYIVDEDSMRRILNGDRVKAKIIKKKTRTIARITEFIDRESRTYIGIVEKAGNNFFFIPSNNFMKNDVFIHKSKINGAKDGQMVAVKINSWESNAKSPEGEVIAVLGEKGENDAEMNAILVEYGLPSSYPKEVELEAEKLSDKISKEELKKRKDYRTVTTITIDPVDAKDFDDAISIKDLGNGEIEVGVHIADVSHYVKPGSIIDKEAYKRATSIYLVDRTIPMLPERLCNLLCSLRPDEEKYAYSCIFRIKEDTAQIISYDICRSVIKSDKRFTYEEAQQIIETNEGILSKEVVKLNEIAKKLRKKRFENGSIAFDRQEMKFELDDKGHPIRTIIKVSKDAHKLVEEFMLLANKTIATHIAKLTPPKTFVYRVHDVPDEEKLSNLSTFAKRLGYNFNSKGSNRIVAQNINSLLSSIQDKPEEALISTIAIRSMAKAVYTTKNIGHYGLAFDYYSHFTSPIRRYPDLMVHRLLTEYLFYNKPSANVNEYEEYCEHSSKMEQLASSAERTSIKYKQVEYMKDHVSEVFDGVISGITEWGIYVELEDNHCEGMVSVRSLDDDYYRFDEDNYCLIGERKHKKFTLGDKLKVKVISANLDKKQLDFGLI